MKKIYTIATLAILTALTACKKSENENPAREPQKLALTVATTDFAPAHTDAAQAAADSTQRILQRAFGGGLPTTGDGSVSTRVGDATFDANDSIGIYIHTANPLASATVHTPNMLFATYDGALWTAEGQLSDLLKSGTTYYATAYHPYLFKVIDPLRIVHSVWADQSTPTALSHSDLMHAPIATMANPTSAPTVALQFTHLLSKLAINFTVPALVDGAAVTGIDRVVVRAVDRTVELNLATGAITAPTNKGDIKMCLTAGTVAAGEEVTYQAIIVPQTVAKDARFVEIYFQTAAGEKPYLYNLDAELVLTRNLKHTRTLVSVGDFCFSSRLDLIDGLAKTKLPLKVKGLKGVEWTLTSPEEWLTLSATADGDYAASITGTGTGADQTIYVNVTANTAMVGTFWEPRTAKLELASSGVSSYYTAQQNFYRFDLAPSSRKVAAMQGVVGVDGFGANQVWSAASGADWIKLASSVVYGQGDPKSSYGPHSGTLASAELFYQIEANNTAGARSGSVIFTPTTAGGKGASMTIEQAAADLAFSKSAVGVGSEAGAGVELFTVTAPVGVKWKILSAAGAIDGFNLAIAVGAEQVGTGVAVSIKGGYSENAGNSSLSNSVVIAFAAMGVDQQKTVTVTQNTPTIKINGVLWAPGNLVADGDNGAKIGSPTDGGLYFQFGSLVGWKGGASGDGTGVCTKANGTFFNTPFNAANEIAVYPSVAATTIAAIGTTWPNQTTNLYYFGDSGYATAYAKLRDFAGFATGTLAASGVGDACRYYLGGTWRMPTAEEWKALCNNAENGNAPGAINNAAWTTSPSAGMNFNNDGTKLFIPASGLRGTGGSMNSVGANGYYWSESVNSGTLGYCLNFGNGNVSPQSNTNRRNGLPVRCVMDAPTEPTPPTQDQTQVINGLRWTTGNLVADGPANAKVGAPTDGGLYFQFGSLVGWSAGANGDGTGTGSPALAVNMKPSGYTGTAVWTTCGYYSAGTSGTIPSTDVAATGIGDPCRFYLGSPWRTPTMAEFTSMCNGYTGGGAVASANAAWQATPAGMNFNNNSTKLFIPASGFRSTDGSFLSVGSGGYYWSASVYDAYSGYNLNFYNGNVNPQCSYNRRLGFPVRCVNGVGVTTDPLEWRGVAAAGQSKQVTVTVFGGATNWTASVSAAAGFTATPLSGKSGDKITLTWGDNTAEGSPARSASITFTASGTSQTHTLVTEQNSAGPEFIVIGGLKWTTGNLVANGGTNAKVGAPTDYGLYFQFGSLVGWSAGANGDGTGTGSPALAVSVKPAGYNGTAVYTTCGYYSAGTSGTIPSTDVAATGIGDPCRFYLGSPWRLPTKDEFLAEANYKALETSSPFGRWFGPTSGWSSANAVFFPAAGRRGTDGSMDNVGTHGFYWSESVYNATLGYYLLFSNGGVNPQNGNNRRLGMPVRCVQ